MSDNLKLQSQSDALVAHSATSYQAVDISATNWTPAKPFKGIVVSVAGNVIIKGIDGVNSPALALEKGIHPLGGLAIIKTGTTATIAAALF